MTRQYRSAAAFKQALEQRLRSASSSGTDFARQRQLVVFDRFLARIALELGDAVILKGGLALELRVERARMTKDVNLRVMGAPNTSSNGSAQPGGKVSSQRMPRWRVEPVDHRPLAGVPPLGTHSTPPMSGSKATCSGGRTVRTRPAPSPGLRSMRGARQLRVVSQSSSNAARAMCTGRNILLGQEASSTVTKSYLA